MTTTPAPDIDLFEFSRLAGERLKQQGMALADENADQYWKASFQAEGERLAALGVPFTSEDITRSVGQPPPGTSPNAVGASMNRLVRRLDLVRVGFVKSTRPTMHASIVSQWRKPL